MNEVDALRLERTALLDELETIYRQVEVEFYARGREQEITYQELRERNKELQRRLDELQETQRMLIRSERLAAMGEMAAAIVHEIRNPLTVILVRTEMMQEHRDRSAQNLEMILRSAEYLKKLTENVLHFSRAQMGDARSLDLNEVVFELEAFVKPIVRNVEMQLEVDPEIPKVLADPSQVEQVLMNLVLNALDAVGSNGQVTLTTGRGSVEETVKQEIEANRPHKLAIEMRESGLAGDFAYVEVRDRGPGIRPGDLDHLFEAFFTTKETGKGTGLGLSIVRTIVAEWGGNVLVASTEGEGTSFKVFLPCVRETA